MRDDTALEWRGTRTRSLGMWVWPENKWRERGVHGVGERVVPGVGEHRVPRMGEQETRRVVEWGEHRVPRVE